MKWCSAGEYRKVLERAIVHARGELEVDDILVAVGKGKMAMRGKRRRSAALVCL
jgi:hypothetical protein